VSVGIAPGRLKQQTQMDERIRQSGILGSEHSPIDLQSPAHQRLGLRKAMQLSVRDAETFERDRQATLIDER
jgi:hypothetical protein